MNSPVNSPRNTDWGLGFETELVQLGLEPGQARTLREETLGHSGEAGLEPRAVFGPPHVYARHLVAQLRAPDPDQERPLSAPGRVILAVDGVSKRYRRRQVLREVALEVRAGEVAAIVGANGCGKSTLLKICAGFIKPSAGRVYRRGRVGFVPQDGGLFGGLTAQEHFVLFGAASGVRRRRAVSTGEHLAARLSWRPRPESCVDTLSGGTRQKLNLVLGELDAPDLLLLDEPYQGFDEGSYLNFWQQVFAWRDAGTAVVVVTHLLHDLDNVNQVLDLGTAPDQAYDPRQGVR